MNKKIILIIVFLIIVITVLGGFYIKNNIEKNNGMPSEEVSFIVTSFGITGKKTKTINNASELKEMLDSFEYNEGLCDGIANYILECSDGTKYSILTSCKGVVKGLKEATISEEQMEIIENYIN